MNGRKKYVVDTCALISYFQNIIDPTGTPTISEAALQIIDKGFNDDDYLLFFPSTVFIEIYKKWCRTENDSERIRHEVFERIKLRDNMHIVPIDKFVLESFVEITDIEADHNFDNHDKQVLAVAMDNDCPLITSDQPVSRYVRRKNVIPDVIN